MKLHRNIFTALLCAVLLLSAAACAKTPADGSSVISGGEAESDAASASGMSTTASDEDEYLDETTAASANGTTATAKGGKNTTGKKPNATTAGYSRATEGIVEEIKDRDKVKLPSYNKSGNKNLTVAIPWSDSSDWVKGWTEAYEVLYKGKVSYVVIDDATMLQRLAAMKATGKAPDCARIDFGLNWPGVITTNLVTDAGSTINFSDIIWSSVKNAQKITAYNGKNYFVVTELNNFSGIVYNKKTMESNGLVEPAKLYYQGKWDWNKFLSYAQELTQDNNNDGIYETMGVHSEYWEGLLHSSGQDFIRVNEAGVTINLNNKDLVRAVNFMTSLGVSKYNVTEKIGFDEAQSMMRAGTLGMLITINPTLYFPDMADAGTLGYAPVPRDPSADHYYHSMAVGGFVIVKGGKNPGAAAEYISAVRIASDNVASQVLLSGKVKENPNNYSKNRLAAEKEIGALVDDMRTNLYPVIGMLNRYNSQDIYYYGLWGAALYDSKPWSAIVEEYTPLIQAAAKK